MQKEKPILFQGAMVRALLDGTKTQTRRIVKLPVEQDAGWAGGWKIVHKAVTMAVETYNRMMGKAVGKDPTIFPYGQPGDRLWVRETWIHIDDEDDKFDGMGSQTYYRASCNNQERDDAWLKERGLHWRPSIHMPRWASRILLEVVSVRVERLQDISEADAIAEGARSFPDIPMGIPSFNPSRWSMEAPTSTDQCLSTARYAFANYFCKVNGKGRGHDPAPWDANPWVWVVEFKRVT